MDELDEELQYVNEEVVAINPEEKMKKADKMVRDLMDFFGN